MPSGVWARHEYDKLPRYDRDTAEQPPGVWRCHSTTGGTPRLCAGWVGCHDTDNLLALRMAVLWGLITPETAQAAIDYTSPVPLFKSGAEAAAHGTRELAQPGPDAQRVIAKIEQRRRANPPATP